MSTKPTLMETPAASHAIGDTTVTRIPEKVINSAELLHLPDHGIFGNGYGLIYDKNSDQALQRILRWLAVHARDSKCTVNTP